MLVHGAAGGVGTAAIQVAKGLGARTIAVVSSDEKEAVAREAGADEVRALRRHLEGPGQGALGRRRGRGARPRGRRPLHRQPALARARAAGVVVVGFTGGSIPEVKVNRLLLNNTEVVGAGWGAYVMAQAGPERGDRRRRSTAWWTTGIVRPIVGARFPLERAAEALELIDVARRDRQGRARRARRLRFPQSAIRTTPAQRRRHADRLARATGARPAAPRRGRR